MSVDLPAPEGPMMAVSSPDWKSPLILFRIHFDSEKKEVVQSLIKSFNSNVNYDLINRPDTFQSNIYPVAF